MFQRRTSRPARAERRPIARPEAIEVLAYPLRQELVDTLEACGGEASAGELAEQLGRPADGLYYHLRLLAAAGLIAELPAPRRGAGGRAERRYRIAVPGRGPLRLAYAPRQRRRTAAIEKLVSGMLRIAGRDFAAALADPEVVVEGPARELWAARRKGWLSDAELVELAALLARAAALLDRPRTARRRRLVSLCFVMAPVRPRPRRRAG
jgi:DNA-binding transcriptional ArsR family regulator